MRKSFDYLGEGCPLRMAVVLATALSLGGCEALEAARRERLQNEAATMRANGPPADYLESVREALRRDLARPDTFAEGRIGHPRPGNTTNVMVVNGVVQEASRRISSLGWIVCVRYRATSLLGLGGQRDSAVFFNAEGAVTRVDWHYGDASCAKLPEKSFVPFSL